jgi:hypothetical protein
LPHHSPTHPPPSQLPRQPESPYAVPAPPPPPGHGNSFGHHHSSPGPAHHGIPASAGAPVGPPHSANTIRSGHGASASPSVRNLIDG